MLHQRAIKRVHLDLVVIEPTAKPAYRTLTIASSTHHIRCPGTQANRTGVDKAHHHPGQGLQVAKVQPMRMLAKHAKQSIIQIRRVLHQSPPRQDIVLSCSGEYPNTMEEWGRTRLTFVSQSVAHTLSNN